MKVKRDAQINEINITPLTDIFLVLLIIMMVITPMIDFKGINLDVLTVGPAPVGDNESKTLTLEVSENNEYLVAGQIVQRNQLIEAIRNQSSAYPDGLVIKTHPEASHEAMTCAMGAAYQAGITKLAVVGKETSSQEKDTGKDTESSGGK